MQQKRIVSGMRPTGSLHLGNLHGTLIKWVELQNKNYDCFYFVADWHALTSNYSNTKFIQVNSLNLVIDWLSVGLNPKKSTIFIQSAVKAHAELFLLFAMITSLSWLERNPTYKEMKLEYIDKDLSSIGFLGYPVLQAADILMYKPFGVPIGLDQKPHIELTRKIAKKFNYLYGKVFPIPIPLLTKYPKILGINACKMSKSMNNAIFISDSFFELKKKINLMFTDPQRKRKTDPGNPVICNVFKFHNIYSNEQEIFQINCDCQSAIIGCVDCKNLLYLSILDYLKPIYDKQNYYKNHMNEINDIIQEGNKKAQKIAVITMNQVREAIKF